MRVPIGLVLVYLVDQHSQDVHQKVIMDCDQYLSKKALMNSSNTVFKIL